VGSVDSNAAQLLAGGPKPKLLDPNQSPGAARGPPAPGQPTGSNVEQESLSQLLAPGKRPTPSTSGATTGSTDPSEQQPPFAQLLRPVPGKASSTAASGSADPLTDVTGRPAQPGQTGPYPSNHTLSDAYTTATNWLEQHSPTNLVRDATGQAPVPAETGKLGQLKTELTGAVGGVLDAGPNIAIATAKQISHDPAQLNGASLFAGSQLVEPALKANGPNQLEGMAQTGQDIKTRYAPIAHGDFSQWVHDYQDHPVRALAEDAEGALVLTGVGRTIARFVARGAARGAESALAKEASTEPTDGAAPAAASRTKTTKNISAGEPGQAAPPGAVTTKPTPESEPAGRPAQNAGTTPPQINAPNSAPARAPGGTPTLDTGATQVPQKPQILRNKEVGDAAADAIAAQFPGAEREITLQAASGRRRVDVLTPDGLAIESKVGRTSLTPRVRQELSRDAELLRDKDTEAKSVRWEFSKSPTTGRIGPTGPLREALRKAGIPWEER